VRVSDDLLWGYRRDHAWCDEDRAPDWPAGVHALSGEGLLLLGLDSKGQLYWDGKPIEVRRRLDLTWRQKALAAATATALILSGLNGLVQAINTATDYGCKRDWWSQACPASSRVRHD